MSTSALHTFIARSSASPYAVGLGLSLASISYFFWGNLAGQTMGGIAIPIHPEVRKHLGVDIAKSVEIWAWSYKLGAKHYGGSGVAAGLLALVAAFNIPEGTPISKNYMLLLSASMLSNIVYTVLLMLSTNNKLLAIRDKIVRRKETSSGDVSLTAAEEQEAITLLQKWRQMHEVRIVMGGLSWVGALAAYATTL